MFLAAGVTRNLADSTWVYSVQVSASAQTNPPALLLQWQPDQYGANTYKVYRKSLSDLSWGAPVATLSGTSTSYSDTNVTIGQSYEYQIEKEATLGYKGYGYLYGGIMSAAIESRGKLILIVATNSTATLSNELVRLQSDLAGDGWTVLRHEVSTSATPASVKTIITNEYFADPTNIQAVFLFGHVPVLQSGTLNYDGHQARPMPADAYYGDMDGDWGFGGAQPNGPDFMPSNVELMVGRVDLSNLPGLGSTNVWPNETELLRNYLDKDHAWRHAQLAVSRRALMGNRRGDENGEATAASGYRAFEPLLGPGSVVEADTGDASAISNRWISRLTTTNFLWAYGCGAGQPSAISGLGTADGSFHDVRTIDVVNGDAHAVFVMLFGSWFGNWDDQDDIMRSFLATRTTGLAACMSGRPHWFMHHMGLGEPIGYSTRLTMNNSSLYQNQSNGLTRAIYIALMGDPTLRQDPGPVPDALMILSNASAVNLAWQAPAQPVDGYYIYRSQTPFGNFSRISANLLQTSSFTDSNAPPGTNYYMVRAMKLQTCPSGSYYNLGQGIFGVATVIAQPPVLTATHTTNALVVSWATTPGQSYTLQTNSGFGAEWHNATTSIIATNATLSVTDSLSSSISRWYRVSSP